MFDYDAVRLRGVILEIARSNISTEAWIWLHEMLGSLEVSIVSRAFSLMPRKTGKVIIQIERLQVEIIDEIKPGYKLTDWSADRLCRVCLLMHLDPTDQDKYFRTIENLFLAAEMAELVALYSTIPVLAYPEIWKMRCAEGIRSNISSVLEAIMYGNPYPARHLEEKAWNQLVLKAFFTDKDVNRIYGLDERANSELAIILSDYAHERWAAGRNVNPLLWRSATKFINERILKDLEKVLSEGDSSARHAAALTIYNSGSTEAREILRKYRDLNQAVEQGLDWNEI